MKKFAFLLLILFAVSFVAADCSPYERMRVFDSPNNYTLDGEVYNVSIREAKGTLNSFDVTINSVTYAAKNYQSSFEIDTGETVYLGEAYAASPVMYTSIDFCMTKGDSLTGEQESPAPQTSDGGMNTNSLLIGVVVVLILIILYLLLRKKK